MRSRRKKLNKIKMSDQKENFNSSNLYIFNFPISKIKGMRLFSYLIPFILFSLVRCVLYLYIYLCVTLFSSHSHDKPSN